MAYGDEKVVVEVTEREDKALEHVGPDGKSRTYYPDSQIWLDLQELQVGSELREPLSDAPQPELVTYLRGEARLEDYDIAVIGEPDNKSRTLSVYMAVRDDVAADMKAADAELREFYSRKPVGLAHVGFNRGDWEVGTSSSWWLSCYITDSTLQALMGAVNGGTLKSLRLGLRLKDLYSTRHPFAPRAGKTHLFLRPRRSDNTIDWPQPANGHIFHLGMGLASVDMRPVEIKEGDDEHEHLEVRTVPPDPVAVALGALTERVAALRTTLKWVGGITAACLVILALK